MSNASVKVTKIDLPQDLLKEIAQKLAIDDVTRIPSSIDFHVIDADDVTKAATKGRAVPFESLRAAVIA